MVYMLTAWQKSSQPNSDNWITGNSSGTCAVARGTPASTLMPRRHCGSERLLLKKHVARARRRSLACTMVAVSWGEHSAKALKSQKPRGEDKNTSSRRNTFTNSFLSLVA
mmetsp:Transcript_14666/g.50073  ORF Transcript_14666/g.50073 Transcript_14666/m.50073 type:complete len:110 (+) Transcript_14666:64-393(+)